MIYSECSQERHWALYDSKRATVVHFFVEIGHIFTETPFKQLRRVDGGSIERGRKVLDQITALVELNQSILSLFWPRKELPFN